MRIENRISKLIVYLLMVLMIISFIPSSTFAYAGSENDIKDIKIETSETTIKAKDNSAKEVKLSTVLTIENANIKEYTIGKTDEETTNGATKKVTYKYEELTVNIVLSADTYDGDEITLKFQGNNRTDGGYPTLSDIGSDKLTGTTANMVQTVASNVIDDDGITEVIQSGKAERTIYAYFTQASLGYIKGAPIHLNITVASEDTSADPNTAQVKSLKIVNPPSKTEYRSGETFNKKGLEVVATLTDDSEVPVVGYTFKKDKLTINDTAIEIKYGDKTVKQEIQVLPSTEIVSSKLLVGQYILERSPSVYSDDAKDSFLTQENTTENHIVVPYGQENASLQIEALDGVEVYVGNEKQTTTTGNTYNLALPASTEMTGKKTEVALKRDNEETKYVFACHKQKYDGLPTAVTDYLCIGSQYTNGAGLGPYGLAGVSTLIGGEITSVSGFTYYPPASLGNYGGYIVYYYKDAICDDPKNPYGVDFIVYGNSHDGSAGFAEPGQVWVSEDNEKWYALAGSLHYDSSALWNSSVTYTKDGTNAIATDPFGNKRKSYYYPAERYYPLFNWENGKDDSITLTGIRLVEADEKNEYGNTLPPYPAFGYADCGIMSTSNEADNPYSENETYYRSGKTDGFDLAWAVDENGDPVTFDNGIHYIKVQTATLIDNGAIGEKSTELHMVRTAKANSTDVGKTNNASKIVVDGKEVSLQDGKYQYNVDVSGIFEVNVETSDDANVYINGARTTYANFEKAPHGIIRVIIQEGEKEPTIYYLTITDEGQSEKNKVTKIDFDGDDGRVLGEEAFTRYYDKDSVNKELPTPVRDGYEFLGWYSGQKKYTQYEEEMPEELSLTARWEYKSTTPVDPTDKTKTITASFRLIGSTLASKDIDLSDEKEESYNGAKYVTWISTRKYTLAEGSTVYDLFAKAMSDAGLKEKGGSAGYVSSIWAPSQFGGYELSEFTNGKYSGWMYTMNGEHTDGIKVQKLVGNAEVVFHYVDDYRYEVADWAKLGGTGWPQLGTGKFHNEWLKAADKVGSSGGGSTIAEETKTVTTDTKTGTVTTPTETKVTEKTNADGTKEKTVAVTVSTDNQTEIIKQATDKKSTEIVLEVASTATGGAQNVQLQLNVSFVKNVSEKTDAALTVNTENGTVSLDQDTIKTVLDEAKGTTITLDVNKVANPTEIQKKAAGESGQILSLTVKSGDKTISDFKTGKVTVTVAISTALQNKRVAAIHIAEDGKIEQMPGKSREVNGKKCYEFTTSHFSDFALVDADELGLETEDEIDAAALVAKLTPVARSAKTAKGYIKVTTSLDKNDKAIISELADAGYTVKYRFYRSTKKSANYKSAITKKTTTYTNTTGKKGTKYFYKVQVRVYDESGKLAAKTALKQCKYACRTK